MLLSKYIRYQGDKHQSKHFRDHKSPQMKLQHQMKCHQLQMGTLIQYAGSSNARLGGGNVGQFILTDSPDKPHVWPEQWAGGGGGGGQAISQPV